MLRKTQIGLAGVRSTKRIARFVPKSWLRRSAARVAAVVSAGVCLASLTAAGAFAVTDEIYHQGTLGASPGVSVVRSNWSYNALSVANNYADLHIFNYQVNSSTSSCGFSGLNTTGISTNCLPTTDTADARCHLLNGTGPYYATCVGGY
jgi:hypothetical protein